MLPTDAYTVANDPLNPNAAPGTDTSVFSGAITAAGNAISEVYNTVNRPPSPTYSQVQAASQTNILIVGGLALLLVWMLSK